MEQWRQKSFQRLDDEVKINSQHYYKINKQPSRKKREKICCGLRNGNFKSRKTCQEWRKKERKCFGSWENLFEHIFLCFHVTWTQWRTGERRRKNMISPLWMSLSDSIVGRKFCLDRDEVNENMNVFASWKSFCFKF